MSYTYEYPRPAVTVDILLVTTTESPKILLIERKHNPYKGCWAFPGGFVDMDEDLETAARRELKEETNIDTLQFSQFKTYGSIHRDPRGRTISIVFYAFVENEINTQAGDDANAAKWFEIKDMPTLAFDHEQIIEEFSKEILKLNI